MSSMNLEHFFPQAKAWVEKLEASPDATVPPVVGEGVLSSVADLLFAGRKIDAIKTLRAICPGMDLATGKWAVENFDKYLAACIGQNSLMPAAA